MLGYRRIDLYFSLKKDVTIIFEQNKCNQVLENCSRICVALKRKKLSQSDGNLRQVGAPQ